MCIAVPKRILEEAPESLRSRKCKRLYNASKHSGLGIRYIASINLLCGVIGT